MHLIPTDPAAFSAFVAALVKAAKVRRRGFRRRPVATATPSRK